MILGLAPFTFIHVVISLVGIGTGLAVLFGLLGNRRMDGMTATFLLFTVATSVTGFFLPFTAVTPAVKLGILSLIVLAPTLAARYAFGLRGAWRWIYVVGAVAALYFNCFVLAVQAFLKVPALHALAPNGSEPPFAIAQGLVLLFFAVTGYLSVRRFRPA
ncbi:MAG TPA: hypothetical protein VGF56_13945 [Rhizomicrobium sp.]|jgi:hypothetical protein